MSLNWSVLAYWIHPYDLRAHQVRAPDACSDEMFFHSEGQALALRIRGVYFFL